MRVYIVLACLAAISGAIIGRWLDVSMFASAGLALVPALLLLFPAVRKWLGTNLSFSQWATTITLGTLAAWLIHTLLPK